MSSVFNYQYLEVRLEKNTRTLFISFRSDEDNYLSMETLFEFESVLAWATTRVEIHSIFIDSDGDNLSNGFNPNILNKLTIERLTKFTNKLQKINQAMMLLPQTVIIDLKMGAKNIACELATACDIRIANIACKVEFNHNKMGLIPCSGGIATLSELVGNANARNWLLSGSEIRFNKLENSGYIFDSYTTESRDEVIAELLQNISEQAPVQRIQTKLGVNENIRMHVEEMLEFEKKIAQAAFISEDWKEATAKASMPAKSMKTAVKLSLVKDEPDNGLPN